MMLTESDFPADIRVKQEAELLQSNGYNVSVVALKSQGQSFYEVTQGINVYRIPKIELFRNSKQATGHNQTMLSRISLFSKAILGYGFEYFYFTFSCLILSFFILVRDRFDVIHTHNPPDTLFVVPLIHKSFGIKFVYDHHDLSPDLFNEKYNSGGRIVYRLLLLLERWSCRCADIVIATNESYKQIETRRCGVKPERIYVVRNGPDLNKVRRTEPVDEIRKKAEIVICYLGAINNQDGLDYLVESFAHIVHKHKFPNCKLLIVGDGDYLEQIKKAAREKRIEPYTIFTGHIADRDMVNRYLSTADIFVDSAPYSFLNNNSTFIKHMEYMVFQKPVVSFALKESMYSLGHAGVFIKPNDTHGFARAVIDLIEDPAKREAIGNNGREQLRALSWDKVSMNLLKAYQDIQHGSPAGQDSGNVG